jgi:rhodanese-related sulfurtransferase
MNRPHQLLFFLCLLGTVALSPGPAGGAGYTSPGQIDGVSTVDADGLIDLYSSMPGLVMIDSRIRADRKDGFIEGSLSLPDDETDCTTLATLVTATDTPVLFYCNGVRCARSGNAARIARDCGYTRVYWFRGGMEEWRRQQYPLIR